MKKKTHGNTGKIQSDDHKNKINTPERADKISNSMKELYRSGKKVCWTKGKLLSESHKRKIKESARRGLNNPSWRGDGLGYSAAHNWLKKMYGKADFCENKKERVLGFSCSGISINYQWAKKKGSRYSRNVDDYIKLCVSCHSRYDAPTPKKCKLNHCERKKRRYGYCEKHGMRYKKHGCPYKVRIHTGEIKTLSQS